MQDKRDELYNNLLGAGFTEDEIGTQQEFKDFMKDERRTRIMYKNLRGVGLGEDEIGTEDDFYDSVKSDFASTQQLTASMGGQQRNDDIDLSQVDAAARVGAVVGNTAQRTELYPHGATAQQPAQQPTEAQRPMAERHEERHNEALENERSAQPRRATAFVSEREDVVMRRPTETEMKAYPWITDKDMAIPFSPDGKPLRTYTDEYGQALSMNDVAIRNAKVKITGDESQRAQVVPASLELPEAKATAVRLRKGALGTFVDDMFKDKYGDDYLDAKFKNDDGSETTGRQLKEEAMQGYYDALNEDVKAARMSYLDLDDEKRAELIGNLSERWKGLMTPEEMTRVITDEGGLEDARNTMVFNQRERLAEAQANAEAKNKGETQANLQEAREQYESLPWWKKLLFSGSTGFYGNPYGGTRGIYATK